MTTQNIKKLVTKFFYEGNYLKFQILLKNNNETQICGEYASYDDYQKAFNTFQNQLPNIPAKRTAIVENYKNETKLANVA